MFATAAHLAIDLSKGSVTRGSTLYDHRRLRIIHLGANGSKLSAWANDKRYDDVYKEELIGLEGRHSNYSLLALSCSGNSPNILSVVEYAQWHGAEVGAMVAFSGGKLKQIVSRHIHFKTLDYGIGENCIHEFGHFLTDTLRVKILGPDSF